MMTCGDLGDGKPCEWRHECHRWEVADDADSGNACSPVLALCEAHAESARWKRAADRLAARLAAVRGEPGNGLSYEGWIEYGLALKDVP